MSVVTKIEPIDTWVDAIVRSDLSEEAQSRALASFARARIDETGLANRAAFGRAVPHREWVDGRQGAPLVSVRKGGTIVAEWSLISDVLKAIAQMLVDRSPVRTGNYVRGHRLFADGVEVAVEAAGEVAQEYVFLNTVSYARKVEIGKTRSGRSFLISVPNKIYQRTARDASRRFGNLARISFAWRSPVTPYQRAGSAGARHSRRGWAERQTRAPAIIVTVR